jgi:hypothetical protein
MASGLGTCVLVMGGGVLDPFLNRVLGVRAECMRHMKRGLLLLLLLPKFCC